jgi:hypothetical protein
MLRRALAGAAVLTLVVIALPRAQQAPAPAPTAAQAGPSSKIWIGHEAEYEEFLRTAKIAKSSEIKVGVTHPHHCYFESGGLVAGAVFKPLQPGRLSGYFESYRSEIAAYEMDKILGLGMVPPTVERKYSGQTGSLQLWVENVVYMRDRDPSKAPDAVAWNRQVYRWRVWDNLIANIDRNQGNLLLDPAWNLILIDHSRAFTNDQKMPFAMIKIDREFYRRLKTLNEPMLKEKLGNLLFDGPKPLLERRDKIIQHFDELLAKYGEAGVFIN